MNDDWRTYRLANTVSNAAFPLVASLTLLLPPVSWADWGFVANMTVLGVGSATWHWKGTHPWNVFDRVGMYLAFSYLAGVGFGFPALAIGIFLAGWGLYRLTRNSNAVVAFLALLAWVPLAIRPLQGGPWLDGAAVLALYAAILLSAELDRHHKEPHRRGAAHPFWHVGAASTMTLHYQLLLG